MKPIYVVLGIAAAVALMIFGYYCMKRLDCFLEENEKRISSGKGMKPSDGLRIAFENPIIASDVSESLEALSKKHPDCKLFFFTGTAEQIHHALETDRIDIGFVLTEKEDDTTVSLCEKEYYSNALGCSVELLEAEQQYIRLLSGNHEISRKQRVMLTELMTYIKEG